MEFMEGTVPVKVAAKIYRRDPQWIRAGIITGYLPIGKAIRDGKVISSLTEMDSRKGRITYCISPQLLYEETGYIWRGEI